MSTKNISLPGKILDIETKQLIAEEVVYITLTTPATQDKVPEIRGRMTLDGFKPEYNDKQFLFEITHKKGEILSGRIRLIMTVVTRQDFDPKHTRFIVYLPLILKSPSKTNKFPCSNCFCENKQ
jgi:hypothetical protein